MKILVISRIPMTGLTPKGTFMIRRLERLGDFGIDFHGVSFEIWRDPRGNSGVRFRGGSGGWGSGVIGSVPGEVLVSARTDVVEVWYGGDDSYREVVDLGVEVIDSSLGERDFDLVCVHDMYGSPVGEIGFLLAERLGVPYVMTVHGISVDWFSSERGRELVPVLERAGACVFVSRYLLDRVMDLGYSGERSFVVYNGYDPRVFRPLDKEEVRRRRGLYRPGWYYVGFVGNLVRGKGVDLLPGIFRRVWERVGRVLFVVVGNGPFMGYLEEGLRGLDVVFTGRVGHEVVADYMNVMDVMVFPSREEGFGCVAVEAQACGTCVVGSDVGGIPEAVGFSDYIVEVGPGFEERFADRVVEILLNGYDRERLVRRVKWWTWDRIVEEEVGVYRRVLEESL